MLRLRADPPRGSAKWVCRATVCTLPWRLLFDVACCLATERCCWGCAHRPSAKLKFIPKSVFQFGSTPIIGMGGHDS